MALTLLLIGLNPKVLSDTHVKKFLHRAQTIPCSEDFTSLKFRLLADYTAANLPVAQMTALADGLDPAQHWLRADPVSLCVDWSHVYQMGGQHLAIRPEEAQAIKQLLDPLLSQHGLQLHTPHGNRWYIQCKTPAKIISADPQLILGKAITEYLLHGEEKAFWLPLFTEIQMLLHDSAINQQRCADNLPTIDALWFWGSAEHQIKCTDKKFTHVISDDPLAIGLAEFLHISAEFFTGDVQTFLHNCKNRSENYFWSIASLATADVDELWQACFLPLRKALIHRKIDKLILYLGDNYCYHVGPRDFRSRWCLWKR